MNKTFKSVTANQIPYLGHQDCHITKTDTLKKKNNSTYLHTHTHTHTHTHFK